MAQETLIRSIKKKPHLVADDIGNYRPIANVSFLSKVVERVVADQLQTLLDETNALHLFQSGFRLCHGMEMALVSLFDDLLREADRGKMSLLVLLNISTAFNTIDHSILLGRLSELGIMVCHPIRLGGPFPVSTTWGKCFSPMELQLWGSTGLD